MRFWILGPGAFLFCRTTQTTFNSFVRYIPIGCGPLPPSQAGERPQSQAESDWRLVSTLQAT